MSRVFIFIHTLCLLAVKAQVSLGICQGSPEPSLHDDKISTILTEESEQTFYLKIPVGNNAHEDKKHMILYTDMAEV